MVSETLTAGSAPAPDPRIAAKPLPAAHALPPVEWTVSAEPVAYPAAIAAMDARVEAILAGTAGEQVWLLEHPALFTTGTGTRPEDLAGVGRFPLFETGRGGKLTYHGPGQRIAYAMLDLRARGPDLRRYVASLEEWIIGALARFKIEGERREDRVGVWVRRKSLGPGREDKIAAIGIRVKKWITLHGISINVAPDLGHYAGILPCGVSDELQGVTSLADLGANASMDDMDKALRVSFEEVFGPTRSD